MNSSSPDRHTCPFCGSQRSTPLFGNWLRCRGCSLGYTSTPYAPEDLADSPEDRELVWKDSLARLHDEGLDRMERMTGRPGRLLDLGCGHGPFMLKAIERGWRCEGIEISGPALRQARDVYGLKVYDRPLEQLDLPPGSYDVVTLWRVLDLLNEPKAELERILRVLKPGGLLWLRINNFSFHYPAFRLGETALFKALGLKPGVIHRYGVTARALRNVFERAGYTDIGIVNSRPTTGDPCGTGGRLGGAFVSAVKGSLFFSWEAIARATGGRTLLASSLTAWARKPDTRKHIVHVITRLDRGGSAECVLDICRDLDGSRYRATLVHGRGRGPRPEPGAEYSSFAVPSLVREIAPVNDLAALLALTRLLRQLRPDIVHTHTSKAGLIGRWAAYLAGAGRIVHAPHGHVFYGYGFHPLVTTMFRLLARATAPITAKLLALTQGEKTETLARGIGREEQWAIVHSGVRLHTAAAGEKGRQALRDELGISGDALVIGTVARLDPVKGVRYLAAAAEFIDPALPAVFLIVGDGPERPEIERIARSQRPARRFLLTGMRDDAPALMTAMDIFVQPSLNEGMGKTLIMAQDAGLPVVATRVQGIPDAVREGHSAFLVPPGDARALAEAVTRLLRDPALRERMGAAGQAWVRETVDGFPRFSHERMLFLLDKLYSEL